MISNERMTESLRRISDWGTPHTASFVNQHQFQLFLSGKSDPSNELRLIQLKSSASVWYVRTFVINANSNHFLLRKVTLEINRGWSWCAIESPGYWLCYYWCSSGESERVLVGVVCSIHPFTNIDAPRIDGDGGDFSNTFQVFLR